MKDSYLCSVNEIRWNLRPAWATKVTCARGMCSLGKSRKRPIRRKVKIINTNHFKTIRIMALKVKAVERNIKFTKDENDPGVWRYVMQPELYIALSQAKVINQIGGAL